MNPQVVTWIAAVVVAALILLIGFPPDGEER